MVSKTKSKSAVKFEEKSLTFWQLGIMLSAGQGLISMRIGQNIAQNYGLGTAITSILVGNFILFFIGLGIISMTGQRSHTIQTIKENFKPLFSVALAVLIVTLFILWYTLHIKYPSIFLNEFFTNNYSLSKENSETSFIRIGAILGLTCAMASMWGLKLIKWISYLTLPIQVLFFLLGFLFIHKAGFTFDSSWGFSSLGILQVILTWLPGTVNLSTFTRHAKTRPHAILSLFFIFLMHSAFQVSVVLLDYKGIFSQLFQGQVSFLIELVSLAFLVLSYFAVNFLNIYWASIGWEAFFKKEQGAKGSAVIGLLGTVVYIFFESSQLLLVVQKLGTIWVANLGVVLIFSALVKILVQHRVRPIDKIDNAICWIVGSAISVIAFFYYNNTLEAAIYGINASLLSCALILFVEEFYWSSKKITLFPNEK